MSSQLVKSDIHMPMAFSETIQKIDLQSSKVAIVGLGTTGFHSAKLLRSLGAQVLIIEKRLKANNLSSERVDELIDLGVEICFGVDGEGVAKFLSEITFAIVSPGVSKESSIFWAIRRREIPIYSELEFALAVSNSESIVVSGSNGKSTTTNLIYQMLKSAGISATLSGNLGMPVSGYLHNQEEHSTRELRFIIDASGYQLETCNEIKPKVAVLLNLAAGLLERYGTIARYLEINSKIFEHQSADDYAVINFDDENCRKLIGNVSATIVLIGSDEESLAKASSRYVCVSEDKLKIVCNNSAEFKLDKFWPIGSHNRYNLAAAVAVANLLGADSAHIESVISSYAPLKHRLNLLDPVSNVAFVDDSKSTTVAATVAAYRACREMYPDSKIHLMLGGVSKASNWEMLFRAIDSNSELVAYGQDANLIYHHSKHFQHKAQIAQRMEDAFDLACKAAKPSDLILFSPACASFDQFSNFTVRGQAFLELYRERKRLKSLSPQTTALAVG